MLPRMEPLVDEVARYRGYYCPSKSGEFILVRVFRKWRILQFAGAILALLTYFAIGWIGETGLFAFALLLVICHSAYSIEIWEPIIAEDMTALLPERGGLVEFDAMVSPREPWKAMRRRHRTIVVNRILSEAERIEEAALR